MKTVKVVKELTEDDIKKFRKNKQTIPSYLLGRKEVIGRHIRVSDADFDAHKGFFEETTGPREVKVQAVTKGKVSKSTNA